MFYCSSSLGSSSSPNTEGRSLALAGNKIHKSATPAGAPQDAVFMVCVLEIVGRTSRSAESDDGKYKKNGRASDETYLIRKDLEP